MKRNAFLAAFCLALTVALPSICFAANAKDASAYIEKLANQTLSTIANKSMGNDAKQRQLERLFNDNVDIAWVGRFVMGRYWRQATDEQKKRYLQHYQTFITKHYTSRFTDYTSGSFKITGAKDEQENEFSVSMTIETAANPDQPILVDYRVRKDPKGGFKVFDIIVEGVSMITTQRSEFNSVIDDHNIDYLISQLETRSKTGDVK